MMGKMQPDQRYTYQDYQMFATLSEQHRVPEYWIVDSEERVVEVYLLVEGGQNTRRGA